MQKIIADNIVPSSFRDPSGFLFYQNGVLFRRINLFYKENYDYLIASGLYKSLTESQLLIPHNEASNKENQLSDGAYKIIQPGTIPFVSYPYEWSFSQLKDAALITLKIQKEALKFGMSLKDCSVYNIQFKKGKPVFIDTLSFEKYKESQPWVAYRQFCQHFLAPLVLMSYVDIRLNQLFRIYIDGIPLDLTSSLLPLRTYFKFSLLSHIHFHAKSQRYFGNKPLRADNLKMNHLSFLGLIDNLESLIKKLHWKYESTEWSNYYKDTNYSQDAFEHKKQLVSEFLSRINPKSIWDFGANIGIFSRIGSNKGIFTISFDIDSSAVDRNYRECVRNKETNILPLLIDFTNPSPGIGWENKERMSLSDRGPADCVFALALVHHLAISNNTPFSKIAHFFSGLSTTLIIEFIPKHDSQVQRLLASREDIFFDYTQEIFEKEFKVFFNIISANKIRHSERILYLMEKK